MSVATFSIESFANIRFPARSEKFVFVSHYFLMIMISSLFVFSLIFILKSDKINSDLIIILVTGFFSNIKLLYLSWLRAYNSQKAITLMLCDGVLNICGVILLYYAQELNLSISVIFCIVKSGGILLFLNDLLSCRIVISITKFRIKYAFLIFQKSLKLLLSSIFLIYSILITKTLFLNFYAEDIFVAVSIGLSVVANIQKLLLSYYWSIQKHVFAGSSEYRPNLKFLLSTVINVLVSIALTIVTLKLLEVINSDVSFNNMVYVMCLVITAHRIFTAGYRLFVLKYIGIDLLLKFQILSLFVNGCVLVVCGSLLNDYLLLIPLVFVADFLFTSLIPWYHHNTSRRIGKD